MTFTFYYSSLCPRCARARKHLRDLMGPELEGTMHAVDAGLHPITAFKEGIRMIPALKCGEDIESGIMLSPEKIKRFLRRNQLIEIAED